MGKKLGYVSLGCAKNLVDTEVMLGLLRDNGYTMEGKKLLLNHWVSQVRFRKD